MAPLGCPNPTVEEVGTPWIRVMDRKSSVEPCGGPVRENTPLNTHTYSIDEGRKSTMDSSYKRWKF